MYITNQAGTLFFKEMEHYYLYIDSRDGISPYYIMLHETLLNKKRPVPSASDIRLGNYNSEETVQAVFNYLQIAIVNLANYVVKLPEDNPMAVSAWRKTIKDEVAKSCPHRYTFI